MPGRRRERDDIPPIYAVAIPQPGQHAAEVVMQEYELDL